MGNKSTARRHRKEDQREQATRRADIQRARTGNWAAAEERARQALQSNRRRIDPRLPIR
jgi:hypothetical protein